MKEPYVPYHQRPFEPRYVAARIAGWVILGAMLGALGYWLWHHG